MTPNEIHNKRAFRDPMWMETDETRKVERNYGAEARCRVHLWAWQAACKDGLETAFLTAHPADRSSEYRG